MLPFQESTNLMRGAWRVIKVVNAGKDITKEDEELLIELDTTHVEDIVCEEDGNDESCHFLWFMKEIIISGDEWAAWNMP